MRCRQVQELLVRRLREPLTSVEDHALRSHLAGCATCTAESAAFAAQEALLRRSGLAAAEVPDVPLSAARIVARAAGDRSASVSRWVAGGAIAAAGTAAGVLVARAPFHHSGTTQAVPHPTPVAGLPSPRSRGRERPPVHSRPELRVVQTPLPRHERLRGPKQEQPTPEGSNIGDERYLNDGGSEQLARWMTGNPNDVQVRKWLDARLPAMRDDFVDVPLPRLAFADPNSPTTGEAVKKYEKEASIVDSRLFRKVSLRLKAASLTELCEELSRQTGVRLTVSRGIADENVTALLEERPAREVMRQVVRLFGYKWSRGGEEGSYHYDLYEDLRGQLAEEEMRNRDLHEALIALDSQMGRFQPFLGLSPAQAKAREAEAKGPEKGLLDTLSGKGWGAVQMYFRTTAAQRLALAAGQAITFRTGAENGDLRLPDELRRPVLDTTRLTLGRFEGSPAIVESGFGDPGRPLAERGDAVAQVTLSLERSELGQLTLHGHALGGLPDETGMKKMFWGGDVHLSISSSPSVAAPGNEAANAALKNLPEFRMVVTVRPEPSCVWFRPGKKPEDRGGFELENNGRTLGFGPDGSLQVGQKPHVTSADVWEAVHNASGMPIIADSYLRVFDQNLVSYEKKPLFEVLVGAGDRMGLRWQKDGDYLMARSTSYFWDKLKEVPARLLRRWETHHQNGPVPLDDVLEMAQCSDAQLDSKVVGYVVGHCFNLEEWGIAGSGGAFRIALPGGPYMRKYLRFLAGLNGVQRERAQREGLGIGDLNRSQQQALATLIGNPEDLDGLTFRVVYAPVGTYLWHPVANSTHEAEELNRKLPVVVGATADAVLKEGRKYLPDTLSDDVRRSRGAVCLMFRNRRRSWNEGGPGVAFRNLQ